VRQDSEKEGEMEADKVSVRITEILSEKVFSFTPDYLISIHRRLFDGVFSHAGQFRQKNIAKREWVLEGESVEYSPFYLIEETLNYEFSLERGVDYPSMPADEALKRICRFVSGIWQVHPFAEGNTRTTAVFVMKYLQNFGFQVDNTVFKDHSWYFRNALVRNNYRNYAKGISATTLFLEKFFRNLLFGEQNQLSNRMMHIANSQSITPKSHDDTLDCTLTEMSILKFIKDHPDAKQEDIAAHIGKSVSTVKRITPKLVRKRLLARENGKRNGHWIVKL
jgi:fido (protein-threonine AMPylation protein)